MATAYASAATDHEHLRWLGGGAAQLLVDSAQAGGPLALSRAVVPAGATSPVHVHARVDEVVVLLRGSAIVWTGDERFELRAGGVAFLPRGVPHVYRVTSEADLVVVQVPASGTQDVAPYVAAAHQQQAFDWIDGSTMRVLLGVEHTGSRLTLLRSTAYAGSSSLVYAHDKDDEIVLLLRGGAIYWIGDRRYELAPGGVVLVPSGVPTAHRITADAEILVINAPGGLEKFFRMVCYEVSRPRPEGWRLSFDEMVRAAAATGHSILALPAEVDRRAVPGRGRRAGSGRRQRDAEAEPLRRVLGVDVAAVGLDDAAHDGEPEARAG
jgi:quercetin dioxygenase-like cupin family protein